MAASLNRLLGAGWLLCMALPAQALEIELLSDPTRPVIGVVSATEAGAANTVHPVVKEGLQSVIISPQHRAAVINGVTVALGGKVGDATLVEVRESSVVLQGAQGRRVLELYPGVRMKRADAATPKEKKPAVLKNKKETKNIKASEPANPVRIDKDERERK